MPLVCLCLSLCQEECIYNRSNRLNYIQNYEDDNITEDTFQEISDFDSTTDDDDDDNYISVDLDDRTIAKEFQRLQSKCKKFFRSSKILKEMILKNTGETQRSRKRKIDDTSYDIFETYTEAKVLKKITKCILDDSACISNINEKTANVIFLSFFTFKTKYCICGTFFKFLKQVLYYYHNMMTKDQQCNWKRYLLRHQEEIKKRMICSLKIDPIDCHPKQLNFMKTVTKTVCFMSADKTGLLPELIDIKQLIRKLLKFATKVLNYDLSLCVFTNYVNHDGYSRNGYCRFATLLCNILSFNSNTLGLSDNIRKEIKNHVKKFIACKKNVTSDKRCLKKFCKFAKAILDNCDNKN